MNSAPSIAESLREYGRGFVGGLLFSLPLLYTMEVWWTSFIADSTRLVTLLVFTFLLLLGYNRFAGLRHDATWIEVMIDSVEELGLAAVSAAGVLYLIGRIGPSTPAEEMIGKIVVETAVVAIGFSVGSAQLGAGGEDVGKGSIKDDANPNLVHLMVLAVCGAVLFAANVAPTEEILVIAIETEAFRLLGVAILSVVVVGGALYFFDVKGADRFATADHGLDVLIGTAVTYAVAIVVSTALLWFFGRFDGVATDVAARQIVVLGFPSAIGAATGRLLLQS